MRSFCSRSITTTSQSLSPARMSVNTRTPTPSTPSGSRVCGPITRTSGTPSVVRPWISERATRECSTSPTIATTSRVKSFLWRIVYRSSSPCVGCAWRPSPALTTCSCGLTWRAMRNGAPDEACRTTKMSACMAERFATVSSSDSPLVADDTAMFRLMTSAERRLAAISNVVRARVEGSKKRLNTLLPRSSGTFFTSRSVTPANDSAVSRICTRISRGRPSIESRCCSSPLALSWGLRCTLGLQCERELPVVGALERKAHARRHFHPGADVLGANRQLAPAAVCEHHERNARRPPVVEKLVHRRAHRAAAVENVVDQQQLGAVHVEWNLGALGVVLEAARRIVVAVEGDVHQRQRRLERKGGVQPFGEPRAAGIQADHGALWPDARPQLGGELRAERFGVRQLHRSTAPGEAAPPPSRSRLSLPCLCLSSCLAAATALRWKSSARPRAPPAA